MIKKIIDNRKLLVTTMMLIMVVTGITLAQPANALLGIDLGEISINFFNHALEIFLNNVLAPFLAFFAGALQWAIALSTTAITENEQIIELWGLIRDLINMVFILVLLVIAFGTIFDTQYGAKHTLFKLILAALLINFSYVIGALVIEFSNILASAFLGTIGSHAEVGNRVAQALQPGSFYPDLSTLQQLTNIQSAVEVEGQVLASIIFAIIFMSLSLIALAVGSFLIIIRIPILWTILIFAPVAWAGYILPQTRKQTWGAWWSKLIEWSFVLPVYMFFIFLGIYFLNNAVLTPEQTKILESFTLTDYFLGLITSSIGRLFQFVLSIFFLFGGALAAKKVCGDAGAQVGRFQSWVGSRIKQGAAGSAVDTAWKQLKETGRIGTVQTPYKGTLGREWTQARGTEWVDPAKAARKEKELVDKEMANLQSRGLAMKSDQKFQQFLAGIRGSDARGLAAKMLLAERGKSVDQNGQIQNATPGDLVEFYQQTKSERTPLSIEYTRRLEEAGAIDKWDLEERKRIATGADSATNVYATLRKMAALSAIKEDASAIYDVAAPVLKVMPTAKERHAFIEKFNIEKAVGKVTSANRAKIISQLKTLVLDEELKAEKEKLLEELKKFNPALVAEATGKNIKDAIRDSLSGSPQNRSQYMSNLVESYGTELAAVLKTSLKSEVNSIFKTTTLKDRKALGKLGIKIKKQRKKP